MGKSDGYGSWAISGQREFGNVYRRIEDEQKFANRISALPIARDMISSLKVEFQVGLGLVK
jgi:hypothetical protein